MAVTISEYLNAQQNIVGPETITVTNEGVIADITFGGLYIDSAAGVSTVTVNGIIDSEAFGIEFYNAPASGVSKVTVGATGQVNSLNGYALDSSHAVNLTNSGLMESWSGIRIAGGASAFTIVNSGDIIGKDGVALTLTGTTAATHTITNNELISGVIDASGSAGADKLNNYGTILGSINLGDGANYVISKGLLDGDATFGAGKDTLLNYHDINGNVSMGAEADIFTNNTFVGGTVDMGAGADKFTNAGEVIGVISMGSENDTFLSGKFADTVIDEGGKDSYDLGEGLDTFIAVGTGSNSITGVAYDVDTIQGGLQAGANLKLGTASVFGDIYDASGASADIFLNLDSVARTDLITSGVIKYAAYTGTGADIGTDSIKGFEEAWLGSGNDIVFGTVNADKVDGDAGTDTIYGGKGNDYLLGGADADNIIGEAGRDLLQGDAGADKFIFRAIADSTLALTGRDRILDFEDGDTIDLSNLTATPFALLTLNADFNDTVIGGTDAPEIRVLTTSFGYTIQVDTTGDNKADMAIDVEIGGAFDGWQLTDFVL